PDLLWLHVLLRRVPDRVASDGIGGRPTRGGWGRRSTPVYYPRSGKRQARTAPEISPVGSPTGDPPPSRSAPPPEGSAVLQGLLRQARSNAKGGDRSRSHGFHFPGRPGRQVPGLRAARDDACTLGRYHFARSGTPGGRRAIALP